MWGMDVGTGFVAGTIAIVLLIVEAMAIVAAVTAVLTARTSQGAVAWAVSLISLPLVALPMYLVLGRSRFHGLVNARRENETLLAEIGSDLLPQVQPYRVDLESQFGSARVLHELARMPFLRGNETRLLIDGVETFEAIFAAIDSAERYVLAEFFIVKDDELGNQFQQKLIQAAQRGCRVYLLYDEVGSHTLSREYLNRLLDAGVEVSGMKMTQGIVNRFQINFRNHRKIVVVDGRTTLIGGLNVGDEYVHKSAKLTPWRDTHMQIDGPSVMAAQIAFVEDWYWANRAFPQVDWKPQPHESGDNTVFVMPSGPDDEYETCGLFFVNAIHAAKKRLWIASPYFVPDEAIIKALQLAAMRGVDVRILIPGVPDKWMVKRAAMAYVADVARAGVKMFEYGRGFLHQKVCLIDDHVSIIGTANFDNRSFRLNFEVSVVTIDDDFAAEVESMLLEDFQRSTWLDPQELARRGMFFKVSSRVARLFAPVL